MNIQEAKEQIKKAVQIYLMKDSYGAYRIPIERQRPVFLLGAPGIGKTAVMEQKERWDSFPYIYILEFIFMKMGKKSALIRMKCFYF